jgi:hypothetical protein
MALRLVAEHVDRDLRDIMSEDRWSVEKRRSSARRSQRESLLGEIDSLHAPVGGIDGSFLDRREHRANRARFRKRSKHA